MKITVSTAATMLILQQLQLTTAIDTVSTHNNYMPILKGAKQHAQLAGYIATDSTDPYWSQFNNAMSIHSGNLKPVQQKAEENDDIIILEAYAQWCGFCQAIAPFYDGAAKHFNNVGGLLLSKVDVGGNDQGNQDLANDLGLTGFPTFYYGKSEDFDDVKNDPPPQLNELRSMPSTSEMISFLSKRFDIGQSEDTPDDDDNTPSTTIKNAPVYTIGVDAYLSDIEKSTSDSLQQALLSTTLISKPGAREAFIDWQTWIADSHPSNKCRTGAQNILDDLDDLWPVSASPSMARSNLLDVNQCIDDYSNVAYQGCAAGGNPGEYTCGLWQTFHSMSVSPNSSMTGTEMFASLRQFIAYFFTCTICQEHFLGIMDKVDPATVQSQDDFIFWLYESHNYVNSRLRQEELDAGSFNVDRPKGIFPSPELCPECVDELDNEQTMLPFLADDFYGDNMIQGSLPQSSAIQTDISDEEETSSSSSQSVGLVVASVVVSLCVFFV